MQAEQADIHLSEDEVDRCRQQAKEVTWRLLTENAPHIQEEDAAAVEFACRSVGSYDGPSVAKEEDP